MTNPMTKLEPIFDSEKCKKYIEDVFMGGLSKDEMNEEQKNDAGCFFLGSQWQFDQDKASFDRLQEACKVMMEALESAKNSIGFTLDEIEKIKLQIFPGFELCGDCEGLCECRYPAGSLELHNHKYHCLGSCIEIDEALAKAQEIMEWK